MPSGKLVLVGVLESILAHTARPLLVARSLRASGYRVVFAGGEQYLDLARREGFEVVPLVTPDGARVRQAMQRRMVGVGVWTEALLEEAVQAELHLYQQFKPDVVLHDMRPSIPISAKVAGLPCVSLSNAYRTRYSVHRQEGVFSPWLQPFAEPVRTYLLLQPNRAVRRRHGVPPVSLLDTWCDGTLVLLTDIPEYAPTRNLPGHFHYVGPLIWEPETPWPSELAELTAASTDHPSTTLRTGPTIYFTLASTGLPALFKTIIEQLREAHYRVIITTGGQVKPADLGPLPPGFYAAAFLPGSQVMQHSDLVVCQAGNGTIYQALSAGIPIVGIPSNPEQRTNAKLMTSLGVGLALAPERLLDPEQGGSVIRSAIEAVLTTPSYRSNAGRLQQILARYDGPGTAVRLIQEHVAGFSIADRRSAADRG